MQSQILEQLYSFAIFILVGFLIGLLFDMFRISRRTFKTSDIITCLEDILFWILTGLLILFTIFKFNNGEIRFFIIVAIFIGLALYMLVFSRIVINTLVKIIFFIKQMISFVIKIIFYPINIILKIFKILTKPIKKLLKNLTNILKKIPKISKRQNKSKYKKDFA